MGDADPCWQPTQCSDNMLFLLTKFITLQSSDNNMKKRKGAAMQSETEMMMKGYGLTTAEMYYHMPDHPHVLNTFVWQDYDLAPDHGKLLKFIGYWQEELDGPLHSVRFVHRKMISPGEWRHVTGEFSYH
jgi:uncharacterized protein Usg